MLAAKRKQENVDGHEARKAVESPSPITSDNLQKKHGKVQAQDSSDSLHVPSVEQAAGAFYLPVKNAENLAQTWNAVMDTLDALPSVDFAQQDNEACAHAMLYHKDQFMMARTQLCQLEKDEKKAYFVELRKVMGDGFMFQDLFKVQMESGLESVCDPVKLEEAAALEEAQEKNLAFLDLSDDTTAYPMIEKWLTSFKPEKGVEYDQTVVYESLSTLGWNLNSEENFEKLAQYVDDIVTPVLDIIRVEETTHLPTGYFAAVVLSKFYSKPSALPDNLKTWDTVKSVKDSIKKWSKPNHKATVHKELTSSRQTVMLLLQVLESLGSCVDGAPEAALAKQLETLLSGLKSVSNDRLTAVAKALKVTAPASEEEIASA